MPTWLKVIMIIVLVLILIVVALGFIGYRWVQSHKGEFEAQGAAMRADAAQFAQGKDAGACVTEALSAVDRCDGITCEAKTKLFLGYCLQKTGTPPDFCAGVPKRTEFIASAKWAIAECARRGHANDQRCTRIILAVQEECEKR